MKETLLIKPDKVEFMAKLPEGPKVQDERYK
jgi:hypothetical protein